MKTACFPSEAQVHGYDHHLPCSYDPMVLGPLATHVGCPRVHLRSTGRDWLLGQWNTVVYNPRHLSNCAALLSALLLIPLGQPLTLRVVSLVICLLGTCRSFSACGGLVASGSCRRLLHSSGLRL